MADVEEKAALAAVDDRADWAIELLQELVRTPSVTGDEVAAQAVVERAYQELGLETTTWCPAFEEVSGHPAFSDDGLPLGARPVVEGRWRVGPEGDTPTLLLNGHIDVVPISDPDSWRRNPWSGELDAGRVHGRGACDMKGGLVSATLAVAALRAAGLAPAVNLVLQSVIGEESSGVGTLAAVLRGGPADAAIILEPTRLAVCPVGAGAASFRLTVSGRAAHGALRAEGVSALDKLMDVLGWLRSLEHDRNTGFSHESFAEGELVATIAVGRVAGGEWPSTLPDSVVVEGRYGVLPGESLATARTIFEERIRSQSAADSWLSAHPVVVEWFEGQFEPAVTPRDAGLVTLLSTAHVDVTGVAAAVHGVPYGSDLRFFANQAGIPAVLYGPGDIRDAHTVDESVAIEEVLTAARTLALAMLRRPASEYGLGA